MNERDIFPLQRMQTTAFNGGETFSMEKLFPNLSTTYKRSAARGPTPIEAGVSAAQFKEVWATEIIHSNTLSKHTRAS